MNFTPFFAESVELTYWNGLIFAVTGLIMVITQILTSRLTTKKADAAAKKVEEVKLALEINTTTTADKLENMAKTGEKVHTLVNSNMGIQLKLNADNSKRIADLTKDPVDIEAAKIAAGLLTKHDKQQAQVDANNDKPSGRDEFKTANSSTTTKISLSDAINAVPEKTAVKVVEKMRES